jgi:branched-chain amino acid transport system ATP-binding protein
LLKIEGITVYYGKARVLDNVSLEVGSDAIVSLIGANGAGKTTILRAVSGLIPIAAGQIIFDHRPISGLSVREIVKLGIVHVPQGRHLFPYLSVMNNLKLGSSLRADRAAIKKDMDSVFQHFPRLFERRNQKAGTLSGGEQQMLAIGRGLMVSPKVLLMDEPSLGLAPRMVAELVPVIQSVRDRGIAVLLVEQNVSLALAVATRGYALKVGRVVLEGEIDKFKNSEVVKEAYLGG